MQEAAAWIRNLGSWDDEDPLVTGRYTFYEHVEIRVDLLLHLIRKNRVLHLKMCESHISSSGLASLFDAAMHSTMRTLDFSSFHFDEESLNALATLMKRSNTITEYNLVDNEIGDDDVALICDGLAENVVVEKLDFCANEFGVEGARSLARLLKATKNKTLASLNLGLNPLENEGVVALVDGLKSNKSLRTLDLTFCGISDDGAIALASLLEHGSHLVELDLNDNEIGEAGLMALANAVKHNRNLQDLDLNFFFGGDGEGIENAFVDVFQSNVALLMLGGIESSKIETLLLRNKEQIPAAVRRAALLLIGIRRSTDFEGMGDFAVFPKDIVRLIAQTVWATRRDPVWIQALK